MLSRKNIFLIFPHLSMLLSQAPIVKKISLWLIHGAKLNPFAQSFCNSNPKCSLFTINYS